MRALLIATALTAAAVAGPASATHKPPVSESYDVSNPVPYYDDEGSHCDAGFEGLSKNTRDVKLPDRGVLTIELSGFLGDWVLELYDDKGRNLGQAAALDPTNTAPAHKLTYKKATPGQQVSIVVCNLSGTPQAKVKYTFTYR